MSGKSLPHLTEQSTPERKSVTPIDMAGQPSTPLRSGYEKQVPGSAGSVRTAYSSNSCFSYSSRYAAEGLINDVELPCKESIDKIDTFVESIEDANIQSHFVKALMSLARNRDDPEAYYKVCALLERKGSLQEVMHVKIGKYMIELLCFASGIKHFPLTKLLINMGYLAHLEKVQNDEAIRHVLKMRIFELIEFLVNSGINIDQKAENDILEYAIQLRDGAQEQMKEHYEEIISFLEQARIDQGPFKILTNEALDAKGACEQMVLYLSKHSNVNLETERRFKVDSDKEARFISPLQLAINKGYVSCAGVLINNGAEYLTIDYTHVEPETAEQIQHLISRTELKAAIYDNNISELIEILERNPDIDLTNLCPETENIYTYLALSLQVKANTQDLSEDELLRDGQISDWFDHDPESQELMKTYSIEAASERRYWIEQITLRHRRDDICKIFQLLKNNSSLQKATQNLLSVNEAGDTAAHIAAETGNETFFAAITRCLSAEEESKIYALKNSKEQTIVHKAAIGGNLKMFTTALRHSFQQNSELSADEFGNTALHYLMQNPDSTCANALLQEALRCHGKTFEETLPQKYKFSIVPLDQMIKENVRNALDFFVKALTGQEKPRCDIGLNKQNNEGKTPIHIAAENDNAMALGHMLRNENIKLNLTSKSGHTAKGAALVNSECFMILEEREQRPQNYLKWHNGFLILKALEEENIEQLGELLSAEFDPVAVYNGKTFYDLFEEIDSEKGSSLVRARLDDTAEIYSKQFNTIKVFESFETNSPYKLHSVLRGLTREQLNLNKHYNGHTVESLAKLDGECAKLLSVWLNETSDQYEVYWNTFAVLKAAIDGQSSNHQILHFGQLKQIISNIFEKSPERNFEKFVDFDLKIGETTINSFCSEGENAFTHLINGAGKSEVAFMAVWEAVKISSEASQTPMVPPRYQNAEADGGAYFGNGADSGAKDDQLLPKELDFDSQTDDTVPTGPSIAGAAGAGAIDQV